MDVGSYIDPVMTPEAFQTDESIRRSIGYLKKSAYSFQLNLGLVAKLGLKEAIFLTSFLGKFYQIRSPDNWMEWPYSEMNREFGLSWYHQKKILDKLTKLGLLVKGTKSGREVFRVDGPRLEVLCGEIHQNDLSEFRHLQLN